MYAFIIPAALALLAAWGVTAAVIVTARDGYAQAPTHS
jgi:hypothetical protein